LLFGVQNWLDFSAGCAPDPCFKENIDVGSFAHHARDLGLSTSFISRAADGLLRLKISSNLSRQEDFSWALRQSVDDGSYRKGVPLVYSRLGLPVQSSLTKSKTTVEDHAHHYNFLDSVPQRPLRLSMCT
jgi:hypothetical protein